MSNVAKLVRLTTNNQVAIPTAIVRHLNLQKGSYLAVEERNHKVVLTPKRVVDEEDFSMYEKIIKRGREQVAKGELVDWEEVKRKMSS
jgi:AbrB family looped-hinge helix DNA binding protein